MSKLDEQIRASIALDEFLKETHTLKPLFSIHESQNYFAGIANGMVVAFADKSTKKVYDISKLSRMHNQKQDKRTVVFLKTFIKMCEWAVEIIEY